MLICFYEGVMALPFEPILSRDVRVETVNALMAGLLKPKVLREVVAAVAA
jgi:hypothetical protein